MNTPFEVNRPTTGALASYITEELLSAIWLIGGLTLVTGPATYKSQRGKTRVEQDHRKEKKSGIKSNARQSARCLSGALRASMRWGFRSVRTDTNM